LRAKGTKRNVEEEEMGLAEFKSFLNLDFSPAFSTISELVSMGDNHDFCRAEAITRSMAVSSPWTSLPKAILSLGLDLSSLR
jgi:hypothetical protein